MGMEQEPETIRSRTTRRAVCDTVSAAYRADYGDGAEQEGGGGVDDEGAPQKAQLCIPHPLNAVPESILCLGDEGHQRPYVSEITKPLQHMRHRVPLCKGITFIIRQIALYAWLCSKATLFTDT